MSEIQRDSKSTGCLRRGCLGCGCFPFVFFLIQFALLFALTVPFLRDNQIGNRLIEDVDLGEYPTFFQAVAVASDGRTLRRVEMNDYFRSFFKPDESLRDPLMTAFPEYHLPDRQCSCILPKLENETFFFPFAEIQERWLWYRIVSGTGSEQIIEIQENPDSLYAYLIWSRYRATRSGLTPISLKKFANTTALPLLFALSLGFLIGLYYWFFARKRKAPLPPDEHT